MAYRFDRVKETRLAVEPERVLDPGSSFCVAERFGEPTGHDFSRTKVGGRSQHLVLQRSQLQLRYEQNSQDDFADAVLAAPEPYPDLTLLPTRDAEAFDLVEIVRARATTIHDPGSDAARLVGVKLIDVGAERYRSTEDVRERLSSWVERLADVPGDYWAYTKRVLHFELDDEPTDAQEEGFALVRDDATRMARARGIEIVVRVEAPRGAIELRPDPSTLTLPTLDDNA